MSMFNAKLQQLRNNVDLKPVCNSDGKLVGIRVVDDAGNKRDDVALSVLDAMDPQRRWEFYSKCFYENAAELSGPVSMMLRGDVFVMTCNFSKYIKEDAIWLLWNETTAPLTPAEKARIEADDRHNRNVAIAAGIGH